MPSRTRRGPARERWQQVAEGTDRLAVPGGWIYRTVKRGVGVATCFIPNEAHRTEQFQAARKTARELKTKLDQLKALLDQAATVRYLKSNVRGKVH